MAHASYSSMTCSVERHATHTFIHVHQRFKNIEYLEIQVCFCSRNLYSPWNFVNICFSHSQKLIHQMQSIFLLIHHNRPFFRRYHIEQLIKEKDAIRELMQKNMCTLHTHTTYQKDKY